MSTTGDSAQPISGPTESGKECSDWQALLERIEAARMQNQINGLAIGTRLDHTNRTLSFLQRETGQTLYGPNGRTRAFGSNHSLRNGV